MNLSLKRQMGVLAFVYLVTEVLGLSSVGWLAVEMHKVWLVNQNVESAISYVALVVFFLVVLRQGTNQLQKVIQHSMECFGFVVEAHDKHKDSWKIHCDTRWVNQEKMEALGLKMRPQGVWTLEASQGHQQTWRFQWDAKQWVKYPRRKHES